MTEKIWMAAALSFLLGGAGALFISKFALRAGLVDKPNERSSHAVPTPRGGGIGILLGAAAGAFMAQVHWSLWLPALFLAAVSFADDKLGLSAGMRLAIQFLCASFLVGFNPQPLHGEGLARLFLVVFWPTYMAATSNFFNFMDGINGIAGITGALAFGGLAGYGFLNGMGEGEILFNLSVAAACLGFLPFNFPRAKVFMGDVGSVLLGFLFSAQVFRYSDGVASVLFLSGFLFLFYADTLTTLLIRKLDGEKLSQAHKRHLYQILTSKLGFSHWQISLAYGLMQAGMSAALLFSGKPSNINTFSLIGVFTVFFLAATIGFRGRAAGVRVNR